MCESIGEVVRKKLYQRLKRDLVAPVVDFQNNVVHDTEIFVNETDLFDRPYGQRYGKLCWLFLEPVLALERAWRDERVHVRKVTLGYGNAKR